MNIKLPSIAPQVPGLKTGNEDQKQVVDSGSKTGHLKNCFKM